MFAGRRGAFYRLAVLALAECKTGLQADSICRRLLFSLLLGHTRMVWTGHVTRRHVTPFLPSPSPLLTSVVGNKEAAALFPSCCCLFFFLLPDESDDISPPPFPPLAPLPPPYPLLLASFPQTGFPVF